MAKTLKKPILPNNPERVIKPLLPEPKFKVSETKPITGPMFISVEKYREIKVDVANMKQDLIDLRELLDHMKTNKENGTEILKETTNKLEDIEKRVTKVHSIIKV